MVAPRFTQQQGKQGTTRMFGGIVTVIQLRRLNAVVALLLLCFNAHGANYYWVGGSGNWSDLTHWATTSGGSSHPSVVPGAADNVYFDANSGFTGGDNTVTLNTTANCADMDWTGAPNSPTFAMASYDLNIYGSLTLISTMGITSGCCINYFNFLGTGTHTVNTAGISLGDRNVDFNGSGTYTLQSAIETDWSFKFSNGTLNTGNYAITCKQFITSSNSNTRTLNLGSSVITVNSNGTQAVYFQSGANFTFNCGTSHFILTAAGADFICSQSGFTFYDLSFTANNSSECRATLTSNTFNDVVFNGTAYVTGGGTFNSLTCNNSYNTSIYNDNTFGTLNIYGTNKIITFGTGSTQTVNTDFQVDDGSCAFPNTMRSSSTSSCTLNVTSGAQTFDYYKLNYMHFQGGPFTANNTMEDTGNTGTVTINLKSGSAIDYYWVGGSGNWGDPTHWATSSGGAGQAADGCLPTSSDNVYFDANSGFTGGDNTVTLNTTANCADMDWTGAPNSPTFDMASYDMNIYGSLTLTSGMNIDTYCCIHAFNFLGTGTHAVHTAGVSLEGRNVLFNGSGTYSLASDITTDRSFYFSNGILNTNNYAINCSQFSTTSNSNTRTLNLGSSVITATGNSQAVYFSNGANFTFNCGTSHFILPTAGADFYCYQSGFTFYDVSFTANNSAECRATLTSNTFNEMVFNGTAYITGGGTFSSLTCNNSYNTSIYSDNTFGNLSIYGSNKIITFGAGSTQTVNTDFQVDDGSCAFPNTMRSSSTSACTLNVTSGAETFDYYKLNYVHFEGGPFTANNTMEDTGNTGTVTINLKSGSSIDYYWVGGSGNWGDPTHWATSSGGAGQAADGCLPTSADNVYFDANSGFTGGDNTVTLNTTANCADMDWTGAPNSPTFAMASYDLNIYGSLTLISTMGITSGCCINYFNLLGTGTHTVNTAGISLGDRSVNFNGSGTYTLQSAIETDWSFKFSNGTLNTGNYAITCNQFTTSSSTNTRTLNLGSSVITVNSSGTQAVYFQSGANFTFNSGTSHFILTAAGADFICSQSGFTFYDLSFTANSSSECRATITSNTFNNVVFSGTGYIHGSGTFNKVEFYRDATLRNDNTADSLLLYDPGFAGSYILYSGTTQTINEYLEIDASGCFPAILRSSSGGSAASISYPAGKTFDCDFLLITDITATGGATFIAGGNSEDNGGNSGWTWGGPTWTTSLGVYYICKSLSETTVLEPENHEFAESYTWSTGQTTGSIDVTAFDTYWCSSSYGLNCTQTDTFHVGVTSYAGEITTDFEATVDSLWGKCHNWDALAIPDSSTAVVVPNGKRLYIGDGVQAYCRNLTIDAGGTLHIGGGRLYVYGDFENNGSLIHSGDSVVFAGDGTGTISGSGSISFYNMYLQKDDASDSLLVSSSISIANDLTFITGIAYVDAAACIQFEDGAAASTPNAGSFVDGKVRKVGSGDFTFPTGNRGRLARLGISALVSPNTFEASYKKEMYADTSCLDPIDHPSVIEYWVLDRLAGASGAKVTLHWEDGGSGIVSAAPTDLCVAHFNGSDWEDYGYDDAYQSGDAGWVRSAYQTSFSPFTFGAKSGVNPLPVELTAFHAQLNVKRQVELGWTTASEINNDYFTVERSGNGRDFAKLLTVRGHGTTADPHTYTALDVLPLPGVSYYRLKQTDFDGTFEYSGIVSVENQYVAENLRIYPNPATDALTIEGRFSEGAQMVIRLVDMLGNVLQEESVTQNGHFIETINVTRYPAGFYWLQFDVNGYSQYKKVILGGK